MGGLNRDSAVIIIIYWKEKQDSHIELSLKAEGQGFKILDHCIKGSNMK